VFLWRRLLSEIQTSRGHRHIQARHLDRSTHFPDFGFS